MILQRVGIPLYLQIKSSILDRIKSGEYYPGFKVPTERELSIALGVSRNTVSAAYKELLLEGVLEARQGRGTFVKTADRNEDEVPGGRRERLVRIIDEAMAKVLELGFTVEQFAAIASIRAKEKTQSIKELRIAIVGCTAENIEHYSNQIGQVANVRFESVLLPELVDGNVHIELLQACEVVVTALEHQLTVTNLMGNGSKVIGVATVPSLSAVIKLARLPAHTKVALVARTMDFFRQLEELLTKATINHLELVFIQAEDSKELLPLLVDCNVLVVSEEQEMTVRKLATGQQEVIPFYYEIDQGSLRQVMMKLVNQTV